MCSIWIIRPTSTFLCCVFHSLSLSFAIVSASHKTTAIRAKLTLMSSSKVSYFSLTGRAVNVSFFASDPFSLMCCSLFPVEHCQARMMCYPGVIKTHYCSAAVFLTMEKQYLWSTGSCQSTVFYDIPSAKRTTLKHYLHPPCI